ncbi:MAG: hypothetical protein ACE5MB_04840 [Anaerolineae bacterium]
METSHLATWAVIALSVVLVLWYFVGRQLNRGRGEKLLRWVREGLPVLGEESSVRWLGHSGFQVQVEGTKPPFRRLGLTILLEPREMLLLWLFNRLRGRRDILVLRGNLRSRPKAELELVKARSRLGRRILSELRDKGWVREEWEAGLVLAQRGKETAHMIEALAPLLTAYASHVVRLSVRKQTPHFLADFSLAGLEREKAEEIFDGLKRIAAAASTSP